MDEPGAGVKWNNAVVASRVFENPTTATVSVCPMLDVMAEVRVGTAAGTLITTGATFAGVTFTPADVTASVTVAVPAMVPVCNCTAGVAVEFAGMLKPMVRPPVANCTVGSSATPAEAIGANVRVSAPASGNGYGFVRVNVSAGCSPEVAVEGPDRTNCGAAATVNVAAAVTVSLAESATVIKPVPAEAKKLAGRVAVRLVVLTSVEGIAVPFNRTVSVLAKLVPVRVNMVAPLPTIPIVGEIPVSVGIGAVTMKLRETGVAAA